MLTSLIYFTLTFIIPLRSTYLTLKKEGQVQLGLWASYWCYYTILLQFKQFLPFLA